MENNSPSRGFIVLPRGLLDGLGISTAREPLCRKAALVWLIEHAAWCERQIVVAGRNVSLARGQLSVTNNYLASKWGWEETRVRRFLALLVERCLVRIESVAGRQTVSFTNFDHFQGGPTAAPPPGARRATAAADIEESEGHDYKVSISKDLTAARPPGKRRVTAPILKEGNKEELKSVGEQGEEEAPQLPLPHLLKHSTFDAETAHASPAAPPAPPTDPRGSRLAESWAPTAEDWEYALSLGLDAERTLAKFKDYWLTKAGKDARKVDWSRVWQTWCRGDAERQPARGAPARSLSGATAKPGAVDTAERFWREKYGDPSLAAAPSQGRIIEGSVEA